MKENNVPTLSIVPESSSSKMSRDGNTQQVSYSLRSLDGKIKIEISKFPFTIGRSLDSDLVINDKNVSRHHAVIILSKNRVIIENRGSLNGIRVNKHKVDRVVVLHGDEIRIAGAKYRLEVKRSQPSTEEHEQAKTPETAKEAYPSNAASNDDQLEDKEFPIFSELKKSLENNEPLPEKKFNPLAMYIVLSIVAVVALATVLTLVQDKPDLTAAVENVKEKIVTQTPETDLAYAGKIGNDITTGNIETQQQPATDQSRTEAVAAYTSEGNDRTESVEPGSNQALTSRDANQTQQPIKAAESEQAAANKWETEIPATEHMQASTVQTPQWEVTPTEKPTATAAIKPQQAESAPVPVSQPKVATYIKPKPAPVKYSSYSKQTSIKKLDEARSLYLSGNYKLGERKLNSMASSSRHSSAYRNKARTLKRQISDSHKLYLKGQSEYAIRNKNQAFKTWTEFLKKERALFPHQTSQYSKNVKSTVALEYESKGRKAYDDNDWKNAYRYWRSAVKMRPKYEIQNAIKLMDSELAMLYSKGNDLVRTNKPKAMAYWSNLLDKAPIDHEYYIKAQAKLRWLESTTKKSNDEETL